MTTPLTAEMPCATPLTRLCAAEHARWQAHLQRGLQPRKRLNPGGLRCPGRARRKLDLVRRRRPARGQGVAQEARVKEQLQHALLCHSPVQGAAQLQSLSARSQQGSTYPIGAAPKQWNHR